MKTTSYGSVGEAIKNNKQPYKLVEGMQIVIAMVKTSKGFL